MEDKLLTTSEVAKILKVTPYTIWKWKQTGELKFVELLPRTIRFKESDIKEFIERIR